MCETCAAVQERIDEAVQKLAADAYVVALKHVRDNREAIDRVTEMLIEKETLDGSEFRTVRHHPSRHHSTRELFTIVLCWPLCGAAHGC